MRNAALCLLPLWFGCTARARVVLVAASAWFVGQAIDEALFGNEFHDGLWEYPVLVVYAILTYLITQRHDSE